MPSSRPESWCEAAPTMLYSFIDRVIPTVLGRVAYEACMSLISGVSCTLVDSVCLCGAIVGVMNVECYECCTYETQGNTECGV